MNMRIVQCDTIRRYPIESHLSGPSHLNREVAIDRPLPWGHIPAAAPDSRQHVSVRISSDQTDEALLRKPLGVAGGLKGKADLLEQRSAP